MNKQRLTLITLPLCPKCKIMRKRIALLTEKYPEIAVEEMGLQTYLGEAMRLRVMDAPIILAGEQVLTGVVDDSAILSALEY